jgi:hypothetical protein
MLFMPDKAKSNGEGRSIRFRKIAGAAVLYFVLIFSAGAIMGVARGLWLAPRIGALLATAAEAPVMVAVVWVASQFVVRMFALPADVFIRFCVGGIAFILLQLGELALAYLALGMDPAAYWRGNATLTGAIGLAAQLCVPWAPGLQSLIQCHRGRISAGTVHPSP